MPKKSKKKLSSKDLAELIVEHHPQARIAHQLATQLGPYLPIVSLEKLAEELKEVVIDEHRLPFKMFVPHISEDLLPIEEMEDLAKKLVDGVRQALSMAHSPSFSIKSQAIAQLLATSLQGEPRRRKAVPVAYYAGRSAEGSSSEKGGE